MHAWRREVVGGLPGFYPAVGVMLGEACTMGNAMRVTPKGVLGFGFVRGESRRAPQALRCFRNGFLWFSAQSFLTPALRNF